MSRGIVAVVVALLACCPQAFAASSLPQVAMQFRPSDPRLTFPKTPSRICATSMG